MDNALLAFVGQAWLMLIFGMVANFCTAASQAGREQGRIVWPLEFVRHRPYRITLGVLASLAAFVVLAAAGEATPGAAFGVGYAGADVVQRMADASVAKAKGRV